MGRFHRRRCIATGLPDPVSQDIGTPAGLNDERYERALQAAVNKVSAFRVTALYEADTRDLG